MAQTFNNLVEKGLVNMCGKIGFKKRKYNFYKPMNELVYATLGFPLAKHVAKGHIYVNVVVGVLHKNVENLYYKLTGYNRLDIMQPTIGNTIDDLIPENSYKEWDFIEGEDNSHLYDDILSCIQTYGFPYQEKMKDFDNLLEAFEKRAPGILNWARDRYLPILYYLKGDKQKGLKFIEEAIERQKQPISETELERLKKLAGPGGQVIIGSGIGKVDPEYLKFAENYKAL